MGREDLGGIGDSLGPLKAPNSSPTPSCDREDISAPEARAVAGSKAALSCTTPVSVSAGACVQCFLFLFSLHWRLRQHFFPPAESDLVAT